MHRIYLMADTCSSGLWTDEPHHGMVPLDGLPLTPQTGRALEAWAESGALAEGLRLWAAVREELGPDYAVGFATADENPYDDLAMVKRIVWPPDDEVAPRTAPSPEVANAAMDEAIRQVRRFVDERRAELEAAGDRAVVLALHEIDSALCELYPCRPPRPPVPPEHAAFAERVAAARLQSAHDTFMHLSFETRIPVDDLRHFALVRWAAAGAEALMSSEPQALRELFAARDREDWQAVAGIVDWLRAGA